MDAPAGDRQQAVEQFRLRFGLERLAPEDLDWSLTHRSFSFEAGLAHDNERLEFLGDALLSAVTAEYLCERRPEAREGPLSKRRAHLVSRPVLGRRALAMGLGEIILLGLGERGTGGTHRLSVLGSALEAVVGVVYLRLGWDACRQFVRLHLLSELDRDEPDEEEWKTSLQELTQRQWKVVPVYRRLEEAGPAHERRFLVGVEVQGRELARATGRRIKEAENEAARLALAVLRAELTPS